MISLSIVPQYHQSMFFPLGDEVTHPYEIIHKLERLKFKDYIFRKQSIPNLMEERVPRLNLPLVSSYGDLLLSFPVILMFSVLENKTTTERKSNKYSQTCPTVNRTLYCFFLLLLTDLCRLLIPGSILHNTRKENKKSTS